MKNLRLLFLMAVISIASFSVNAQQYGNLSATILASSARTATSVTSTDMTNISWRGIHLIINTTAVTSGTYTPTIQGKDPVSGNYYTILAGAAISTTGTVVMRVYPGITIATNTAASDFLPRVWRISFVGASTPSAAFSVGALLEQ